jgi:hypothetical protein
MLAWCGACSDRKVCCESPQPGTIRFFLSASAKPDITIFIHSLLVIERTKINQRRTGIRDVMIKNPS